MAKPTYSDEQLIEQLQALIDKLGRQPTAKEFDRDPDTVALSTATLRFGSWKNYLEQVGLKPLCNRRGEYTKWELVCQGRILKAELKHSPTADEFQKDPRFAYPTTIICYFGSWDNFIQEVDSLNPAEIELFADQAWDLAIKLRRPPTSEEFDFYYRSANSYTIAEHYGSWKIFLAAIGL